MNKFNAGVEAWKAMPGHLVRIRIPFGAKVYFVDDRQWVFWPQYEGCEVVEAKLGEKLADVARYVFVCRDKAFSVPVDRVESL